MQTFLCYTDPWLVADALDQKRHGKQRVEGNQILDLLEGRADNPWKNHPATRMWRGYEMALRYYINIMISTWIIRGCVNNLPYHEIDATHIHFPPWMWDNRLVYSHRANLIQKFPEHYGPMWPEIPLDNKTPYWWPVELKTKKKQKELSEFWGNHSCILDEENNILLREEYHGENYSSWNYITN